MAWLVLVVAGVFEVATSLNYSRAFTRLWPSLAFLVTGGSSFYLLALALRTLPVGTAYAVWVGIGAVGTAAIGILVLGEAASPLRGVSILLIVAGIGLKLAA